MKRSKDLDLSLHCVVGLSDEYKHGFEDPKHCHEHDQLLYACNGVMSIVANDTAIVLPPQRALWIPAGVHHAVTCRGPVSLRTLYIKPEIAPRESSCHVLEVGQLLRALILEVSANQAAPELTTRDERLRDLLLIEIEQAPKIPHMSPMPTDARLIRVCDLLVRNPSDKRTIDEFAQIAGMSRRNFTRHFKQETGMSLNMWRQQIRLQEALSLLLSGAPVNIAANKVGYESVSAFISIFQRTFGISPGRYEI
ncbi:MAG: helix-turn-helix transcriptional regulator [Pseudomonadales bacterium]|nr:helix-turn-helix transcriptional regulator [Pseudomonadales bacterium]